MSQHCALIIFEGAFTDWRTNKKDGETRKQCICVKHWQAGYIPKNFPRFCISDIIRSLKHDCPMFLECQKMTLWLDLIYFLYVPSMTELFLKLYFSLSVLSPCPAANEPVSTVRWKFPAFHPHPSIISVESCCEMGHFRLLPNVKMFLVNQSNKI